MIKCIKSVAITKQHLSRFFTSDIKNQQSIDIPKPSQLTQQAINKYPRQTVQQLSNLQSNITQFIQNLPLYVEACKKSPLSYLALFSRSCLISGKYLPQQSYYPIIKKTLNSDKYQLTPFLCTALAECFTYFKYEGDESKVLDKLCSYYRDNYCLFNQQEESAFWEFYMNIMSKKAHGNVKFINLQRRRKETIQFAPHKQIISRLINMQKINKNIIKRLHYENNQIYLTITRQKRTKTSGQKPIEILIRVKGLVNFNEYVQYRDRNELQSDLFQHVMEEVRNVNGCVKKGWNVLFHGSLERYVGGDDKYRYTDKDGNQEQLGYIKSQKVQEIGEIGEPDLNHIEHLTKLRVSNRYHNGIFYNSTNPNKRLIDSIPTLILSISPKLLQNSLVKFHQQNSPQSISQLSAYLTTPQLKQIYGYSKLCQQHRKLHESYLPIQNLVQHLYQLDKQQKYNIDILKEIIDESEFDEQEIKQIIGLSSQLLAQLTLDESRSIGPVRFHGGYDNGWQGIHQFLGNCAEDVLWQFRPFFGDVVRIMDEVQILAQKAVQRNEKNVKIKIITSKNNLPYLVKHLVQAKYWTVPKRVQNNKQLQKLKEALLSELLKKQ